MAGPATQDHRDVGTSDGQLSPPKAIFPTDPTQTAEQIVCDEISRWSLEVTFEEGRAHLGIETQRQWSDRATRRSTPLLFGLYSLVTLFGQAAHSCRACQPGFASRPPPGVPCSFLSDGACGAIGLFPHHPLTLPWF